MQQRNGVFYVACANFMRTSLELGQSATRRFSWSFKCVQLGAAVQRGLKPGIRGIAIVRSRYQTTTSDDTVRWKRLVKCGN
jgi:hypothetical protein